MPKFEVNDWPGAVEVLASELNRQASEISGLKVHVQILQSLLVREGLVDKAALDHVFEACAKISDQDGRGEDAKELRSLKACKQPLADILTFPSNDNGFN